ncbi:membrane protein [Streptomyces viridochromogenes]|uniref:Membrane protein n=1 Tax=Streptomyces viridochromogenes TaxID=1938 RepID=A0A0J7ZEC3_STRVR|nr:MAB_1171c family putative transporter [Streptomyces viridochromogenes]KMS73538.1 membrane protein [Streptomyces viridochromogenes]KOG20804.1 membrane protein [Streptomyces viridochromogenes]KOG21531.1 membrane protein [Streptomyces viridochromogenes]
MASDSSTLFGDVQVSFWIPTVALTAALAIKLPSIVRLWRDPLLRAVGGLLLFACAVFVFAAPSTIAWTNRVTGVPNISAPWVYSLITALCASWLLLIIAWRNGLTNRSAATRRATRWVVSVYVGVVVALWVLFALADAPVERLRDLDTYYATTPFMREQILLYLLAHTVACAITARLIWNWIRTDGLDAWLRWGLRFLGVGYATNLLFDASKLTAVFARWTGHDLDWLSTDLAPSAACVSASLVAVGFIIPHAGQYLHEHWRIRLRHRHLRTLSALMRSVTGGREPFTLRGTAELRLIRRETFIRDALLQVSRHLDENLRGRSYDAALALGAEPARAEALAAAVMLLDAIDTRQRSPEADASPSGPDTAYLLREIQAVSQALRQPDDIEAVRARATAPAESAPA